MAGKFEERQIGNMTHEVIHSTEGDEYGLYGSNAPVPSLAQQWRAQGISWIETDPVATEKYTTEDLKAMGMIGVTLVIPKSE